MLEVDGRAGEASERDVAHYHQLLRFGGHAGDAETARPLPFVHVAVGGEGVVFAMLRERDVQSGRVLERAAHQPVVLHAVAVVGEDPHTEGGHLCHRRELLAVAADADRSGDVYVAQRRLAEIEDLAHDRCAVDGGLGVRHRDDRGEPAKGCRARPGFDGLRFLSPRFPQVRVKVDEARREHAAAGVHDAISRKIRTDRGDPSVLTDRDVAAAFASGVDDPATLDHQTHWRFIPLPSNRNRTAMRTATPLRT
jgi:hypothetical protein